MHSRTTHVISDVFDPNMGSEFLVPFVALNSLCSIPGMKINLWTVARGNNQASIEKWLVENRLNGSINVRLIPMRRATPQGHHRYRLYFIMDLIEMYDLVFREVQHGDVVWKCGQVNFIFNLIFLLKHRCDVLGPVSGLEHPSSYRVPFASLSFKTYYLLYGLVIVIARSLFKSLVARKGVKVILGATSADCRALSNTFMNVTHHMEVTASAVERGLQQNTNTTQDENPPQFDIIWAGAMISRKNPILALNILIQCAKTSSKLRFLMLGDGPLYGRVRALHARLPRELSDRIKIASILPRPVFLKQLSQCRVMLVTALREVNSVQVLEALLCDVCVVSSDVSGMRDTVAQSGYLYDVSSPYAVERAAALLELALQDGPKRSPSMALMEMWQRQYFLVHSLVSERLKFEF